jgi:DNA-binding HxlR family transcriptional regulator
MFLHAGPYSTGSHFREDVLVSERMLTQQLQELDDAGIVHREVYREVPPKVEYSMTEYGRTQRPIMTIMCEWGRKHIKRIKNKKK